ncbi:dihydrolipoamide acetyltransferase family protein [Halobellus rarus]|uniref:Dihydrolipoamide acetyltransferase family protein n=1 Tax=Halobellus rarus TaxID=1126237 RepID=A0ABD6CS25_9EURY|nr:dihydrolipoamide acetyltransferase family protein [Halobellus rarus]
MQKLTLPKSGQGMTEGLLLEWHFDVGESVSEGDPVLDFESEKMVGEVAANQDGVLLRTEVEEGETVAVGTVLGWVGEEGETPPETEEPAEGASESEGEVEPDAESNEVDGIIRGTPTARRKAREVGVDIETVGAELGVNRVTPKEVEQYISDDPAGPTAETLQQTGDEILGSPWARTVAAEEGVDIQEVGETLGESRIQERHIKKYLEERPTESEPTQKSDQTGLPVAEEISITGGEKVMFDQMSRVAKNYASTTTAARVDVTSLLDLYDDLKTTWVNEQGDSLSLTAFTARAVSQTLPEHPRLNAEYVEEENVLRVYDQVNLGIAVNSDDGLIVPTIYDTEDSSVKELSRSIEEIAAKVNNRELEPEDLENGTFSISNAGSLGAYINTPQINHPQTAILGVCKIFEDAGVVDGEVVPRKYMHLCLTYDHRVIEGAEAVGFLQSVKSKLESPKSVLQ